MAPILTVVKALAHLLIGLLATGECFVISSKIDLPSPAAVGLDSSLSPKLVKAFYEVNFVPVAYEALHDKLGEASIILQDPSAPNNNACKYPAAFCKTFQFAPTRVATVQKVEDMIRGSAASETPLVVPLAFGENRRISDYLNEINKTVNRVVNISPPPPGRKHPKGTTTTTKRPEEVPVYKGVIDTKAVLEKAETPEATHRPPAKPYYPPGRPFYQDRPNYRVPWKDNPCLRNPCPPDVWLKAPYPAVTIDTKL